MSGVVTPAREEPPVSQPQQEGEPRRRRPSLSTRWGIWVAHHRWWVLAVWGVLIVVAVLVYPHLMSSLSAPDYSVNGSDSKKVAEIIGSDFTAAGAEQDVIVFDSATLKVTDQEYQDVIDKVLESVRGQPGVVSLVGPTDPGATDQVSADEHAALASFGLSGDDRQRSTRASDLQDRVTAAAGSGAVEAYLTGYSASSNDLTEVENADVERAKSIGIPVAFVVLIIALGTVVAAFIPLLTAVIRLTFTFGVLSALVLWRPMDSFLLSIVTMLGVGISIDYSLFVFGCVLLADVLELKEFGFALAAAVVLDATLIRLLLVPAIMKVAGGKADWWLPGFLERILPRVKVEWLAVGREGTAHHAGEAR